VRETLARRGVPAEQIRRLVAPAGLDIGARRGDEIALSILAQIIQVRRAGTAVTWLPAAESPVETATAAPDPTAVDPVCGMTVDPQNARAVVDHQGTRYFFCCPGCAERFRGEPVRYLPAAGAEPAG
jgi:xanthine dehydrogenase accessory factor